MTVQSLDRHIEITPGICGGKPRIAGHRITVQFVAFWHLEQRRSVEEICADYNLAPADVYAALAYYLDHREQIDQRAREDDDLVQRMRQSTPSLLEERLKELPGE